MDEAKGQIETRAAAAAALGHGMLPVVLQGAGHQQHTPVFQREHQLQRAVAFMAKEEIARFAEGERGDAGISAELALVIRMPAHRVGAVAVPVQQHAVEPCAESLLDALLEVEQARVPGVSSRTDARIFVVATVVTVEGSEPRQRDRPAVEPNVVLLPADVAEFDAVQAGCQALLPPGTLPVDGVVLLEIRQAAVAGLSIEEPLAVEDFAVGQQYPVALQRRLPLRLHSFGRWQNERQFRMQRIVKQTH